MSTVALRWAMALLSRLHAVGLTRGLLAVCVASSCSSSGETDSTESTESTSGEGDGPSDGDAGAMNSDTTSDDDAPSVDDEPTMEALVPPSEPEVAVTPVGGPGPLPEPSPTVVSPEPVDMPPPEPVDTPPQPEPVPVVPPVGSGAPVCGESCGNGAVDSCEVCTDGVMGTPLPEGAAAIVAPCDPAFPGVNCPPIGPICTTYTEQCDGSPNVDQTCESAGYTAGTLACSDSCYLDGSGCTSCPTDARFVACDDRVAGVDDARVVALATNDDSIGVAWGGSADGLRFGLFDADLMLVTQSEPLGSSGSALALATLPAGWLVASGTYITVMDGNGGVVSTRQVPGQNAMFASTGSSTPLIVWEAGSSAIATLLDESGEELWQTPLTDDVLEAQYGSAVAVNGGFLVALRSSANGVQVHRLDAATGEVTDVNAPSGSSTEYPQLASDGSSARAVWADFSGSASVYFATLDERGARVGDATLLGGSPDYFNRSPIAMVGEDTLVVFGGYTGTTGQGQALHLRRVDPSGGTVWGDVRVQYDPNFVAWPQLRPLGDEFVVAWVTTGQPGRLGLTKVTP